MKTQMTSSSISFAKVLPAEREKSERYRLASLKLDVELVVMKARAEKAEAELAVSESERMEQARLLGKGGSREAALLAELAAMKSELGKMLLSASEKADRNVQLQRRAEHAEAAKDIIMKLDLQKIGNELGFLPGVEISTAILPGIKALKAKVAELEADRVRLDWLLARGVSSTIWHQGPHSGGVWVATYSDRDAIDAAMKEASK
jgi:hypothetical protein